MPLYDFACKSCDNEFEDLLIKSTEQNPKCAKCGNETERLISAPSCGIVIGSEHRSLDCIIGADSEKKWQGVEKRKQARLKKETSCFSK